MGAGYLQRTPRQERPRTAGLRALGYLQADFVRMTSFFKENKFSFPGDCKAKRDALGINQTAFFSSQCGNKPVALDGPKQEGK